MSVLERKVTKSGGYSDYNHQAALPARVRGVGEGTAGAEPALLRICTAACLCVGENSSIDVHVSFKEEKLLISGFHKVLGDHVMFQRRRK